MKTRFLSPRKAAVMLIILNLSLIALLLNNKTIVNNIKKEVVTNVINRLNGVESFISKEEKDYIYLSDIKYTKGQTAWGSISLDKTSSNTLINLKVNGTNVDFKKGIFAHATSTLEYDLTNYKNYKYFVSYYGVNTTSGNRGNGVKFYIYTSNDGINWDIRNDDSSTPKMSNDNASYIKLDISNVKYLKLYANDNGANGNDHSVWADAKLTKENYNDNVTKTVEEFDKEIKEKYKNNVITDDLELLLLQRELVNNVGQYQLKSFIEADEKNIDTLDWLMNNKEVLKLYIVGGKPDGSYYNSLTVLSSLYQTYNKDLDSVGNLSNGEKLSDLYLRMMISLSLTHSTNVGLWTGPKNTYNGSDALNRYAIYKRMHENNLLNNSIFESLTVEEMRFVMNNIIDDEEIEWINNYASKKGSTNPYSYITYKFGYNYSKEEYYDKLNYNKWNEKYGLSEYNISYKNGYPKLWIVFEEGGVCGAISKTGCNIWGSYGVPTSVVHQPGHAAYIVYSLNKQGDGIWSLWNDVSGWSNSGYTEVLSIRMPNGWGNSGSEYVTNKEPGVQAGSYILLAQAAQNEYKKYEKAEETLLLINTFNDNLEKKYEIYNKAIEEENINFDAWLGLSKLYSLDNNKSEEDCYKLSKEIVDNLTYYPLPMYDLLRILEPKFKSPEYKNKYNLLLNKALISATKATEKESIQAQAVKQVANALLGNVDTDLASFSFDGENANTIILANKFKDSNVRWEYSINGGSSWKSTSENSVKLSKDEIENITVENDIKVHIVGTNYNEENIFVIDITKSNLPILYNNDLENKVIGVTDKMEWKYLEGTTWNSYKNLEPDLTGNKTIEVRMSNTETKLASDSLSYDFTEDNQPETAKYISISHLSIKEVSSQNSLKEKAENVIDGNINTIWHNNWDGSDKDRFITIKLDSIRYLSKLQYVPRQDSSNGRMIDGKVYVSSDGVNYTEVGIISNCNNNKAEKDIILKQMPALYVKLEINGYGGFASAAMINLFEDKTKKVNPTASIKYNITKNTNKDVVVSLIDKSKNIKITNNNGNDTYTFKENGEFTFEFEDENGLMGSATAKVTWIDKKLPTASIRYNNSNYTNKDVVAFIKFSEKIKFLDKNLKLKEQNENEYVLTFDKNKIYKIGVEDLVGNKNYINVSVSWIDKEIPIANIEYSNVNKTTQEVKAKLIPNEKVEILNYSSDTYTFKENGEFTFKYKDLAGNYNYTTARVDWIEKNNNQKIVNNKIDYNKENKLKTYSLRNFSVKVLENLVNKNSELKINKLKLNSELINKFSRESEYYEIYMNNNNDILLKNIPLSVVIRTNLSKKLKGIYKEINGEFVKVEYDKNDIEISFEDNSLGRYIIFYENEAINENKNVNSEETKMSNVFDLALVVLAVLILILILKKNRNK